MTTYKCNCCNNDFDFEDLEQKIAILDKHVFDELSEQVSGMFDIHDTDKDYITLYINLLKNKVEMYNVCEECEHNQVFKYTDKLFNEYKTILQLNNDTKHGLFLKEDLNYNECYLCNSEMKDDSNRNESLYFTDEFIHDIKNNPSMLENLAIDELFGLVSQNTKMVVACNNCYHNRILPNMEYMKNECGIEFQEANSNGQQNFKEEIPMNNNARQKAPTTTKTKNQRKSLLEELGENLLEDVHIAKLRENKIFGRNKEVDSVINIISKRDKNNPIIIGKSGVGKTSTVHKLCLRVADGEVPSDMLGKKIYEIKVSTLVAGTRYRGDLEAKLSGLLKEIKERDDVIIFIDEIHQILGAGDSSVEGTGISEILKPALSKGEITCIGATTVDEYKKTIERNAALNRRFQTVMVNEPSHNETINMLRHMKDKYEQHHAVVISDDILEEVVRLSSRYITDRLLPDKAVDLLDQSGALLKVEQDTVAIKHYVNRNKKMLRKLKENKEENKEDINNLTSMNKELSKNLKLSTHYVHKVINDWTGIDVSKMQNDSATELSDLDKTLKSKVIGQEQATDVVARYIQRAKVGLHNPKRPLGVSLLVGPTGTGKTELAKVVNDVLNGNQEIIRFDLSEYASKHEYSKLIGAPSGYTGYDEGGQLTDKVKRNPNAVILFDEIEKGHPNVFNLFLQIFDEGFLTDGRGERVDFRNTMIFLTSNLIVSTKELGTKSIGFSSKDEQTEVVSNSDSIIGKLKQEGLRPEFLNRIDEIILFNELDKETVRKICDKKLYEKMEEVSTHNQYIDKCTYDANVVEFIAERGFKKEFGARPINRAIEEYISNSLTDFLIQEKVFNKKRKINCKIAINDNKVVVSKK